MKNGVCPKCGGTDIHRALHADANHIRPAEGNSSTVTYTTHYVCRACGFVEEWIKPEELPLLRQNFKQT